MTSAKTRFTRPVSRWAVSVLAAVAIHVVLFAAAWPWVKPYVLPAESDHRRIDRRAIEAAMDGPPIITGSISSGDGSGVTDSDYVTPSWETTEGVAPADARLPFSSAIPLKTGDLQPIAVPRRSLIAPKRPTITP